MEVQKEYIQVSVLFCKSPPFYFLSFMAWTVAELTNFLKLVILNFLWLKKKFLFLRQTFKILDNLQEKNWRSIFGLNF